MIPALLWPTDPGWRIPIDDVVRILSGPPSWWVPSVVREQRLDDLLPLVRLKRGSD